MDLLSRLASSDSIVEEYRITLRNNKIDEAVLGRLIGEVPITLRTISPSFNNTTVPALFRKMGLLLTIYQEWRRGLPREVLRVCCSWVDNRCRQFDRQQSRCEYRRMDSKRQRHLEY